VLQIGDFAANILAVVVPKLVAVVVIATRRKEK
jgi:hypothetical protein